MLAFTRFCVIMRKQFLCSQVSVLGTNRGERSVRRKVPGSGEGSLKKHLPATGSQVATFQDQGYRNLGLEGYLVTPTPPVVSDQRSSAFISGQGCCFCCSLELGAEKGYLLALTPAAMNRMPMLFLG